ncbi:OTU domain-containing protein 5 [Elysia marginata]|uniref:ubiquitinyl hydrolase 1 n=1 Tax=Elysia marginata TaxID=1093978 RepID=A0AAV4HM21_9GAST|nr:OTU domain-containing protein 5 [Elysia marginata]
MTIKPKKSKTSKEKSDNHAESSDAHANVHTHGHGVNLPLGHNLGHQHGSHSHYHHSGNPERGRTSPTRWLPSTSSRDDISHAGLGQNLSANASYDFDNDELPPVHKRWHRLSPPRSARKHRNHGSSLPEGASSKKHSHVEDCDEDYNSEDEHSRPAKAPDNLEELEQWFEQALSEKKGFIIKKMGEDGACLFRAVADQIYGDQEMHGCVRKMCLEYMQKNAEFYSQYVTEDFTTYINRKKMDKCHGNHLEIQAMTELFNRPVEVYQYSLEPMNTFDTAYKTDNPPIRLSYHGNVHYNSIVDPYAASIGVGLGLPGYQPGLADRNQMRDAIKKSEAGHIEQTMLEDKLRETDWEVTQDSIEEQVARESYLQWLREQEKAKRRAKGSTKTATCSSTELSQPSPPESGSLRSPRQLRSGNNSPQQQQHQTEEQFLSLPGSSKSPRHSPQQMGASNFGQDFSETASMMTELQPALYGLSDWSEEDILAQVMAQSQQEYLESLKQQRASTSAQPGTSSQVLSLASPSLPSSSSTHPSQLSSRDGRGENHQRLFSSHGFEDGAAYGQAADCFSSNQPLLGFRGDSDHTNS